MTIHIMQNVLSNSGELRLHRYLKNAGSTGWVLVVAEVREILEVTKQAAQKFDGERFNLGKLNELEFRKQYQIEISNRLAALGNLLIVRT